MKRIVIGTRGSALAMWQAHHVESLLRQRMPGLEVVVEIIKTKGDKILDVALSKIGDKGLFTKELETAILDQRVSLAVHSMKDMPTRLPDGLVIAAVTARHAVEDALVAADGMTLEGLPTGATVATSSLRRQAQLLHLRPDLNIVDVRGNVQTRLERFHENGWDAMVLARAGLERLGLEHEIAQVIPVEVMLPATGQGALCIETAGADQATIALLRQIEDTATRTAIEAERSMLGALEGGCQVPIGAHARVEGDSIRLDGLVASLDGRQLIREQMSGPSGDPVGLGRALADRLVAMGAGEILAEIR